MDFEKIFFRLLRWAIIIALLTPLVIGPIGISLSAYPKAIFFRIVIEAALIFYLILVLINSRHLFKMSPIVRVVFVFIASLIVSGFFGINFYRSIFGDPERSEGVILIIHLAVFFLIAISVFKEQREWFGLMRITAGVGALSSLAAVLQRLAIFSFYGNNLPERVSGTLSNPDFFATYISVVFFITLLVFSAEKEKDMKIVWLFSMALDLFALFASGTRGAWVGLAIGIVFLIPSSLSTLSVLAGRTRKFLLFLVLLFSSVILILAANPGKFWLSDNRFFWNSYSIFELDLGSRKDVWTAAFKAWKERPVFGWGTESFGYVYDKTFQSKYLARIPEWMFFDRPHNKILDVMESTGIIGLISYLAIFFIVFYAIFKNKNYFNGLCENKKWIKPAAILSSAFICYFLQNLFYFDTISSYIIFFLLLGFVNLAFIGDKNTAESPGKSRFGKTLSVAKIFFTVPLILISLWLIFALNIKTVLASIKFPMNVRYENTDISKVISEYESATNKNTFYDKDFRLVTVERFILLAEKSDARNPKREVVEALSRIEPYLDKDSIQKDRRPSDYYRYLSMIIEKKYLLYKDTSFLSDMDDILDKAISFNNQKPEFYLLKGEVSLFYGDIASALNYFLKAKDLYPKTAEGEAGFYRKLGAIYLKSGDNKRAAENFEKAIKIHYYEKKINNYSIFSDFIQFSEAVEVTYYRDLGDIENCKKIYGYAAEIYPESRKTLEAHFKAIIQQYNHLSPEIK